MTSGFSPLVIISFVTAAMAASVAAVAWRRRAAPGARALSLLMLAVTVWTFFRALEAAAVDIADKVRWAKLEYFGIVSIGPLWLLFALGYARQIALPARSFWLLWVIPIISLVLVLTNEHHHLIWTSIERNPRYPIVLLYGHGAWFWVLVGSTYVLLAAGAVVLVLAILRFPAPFRSQPVALLLAVSLPWCGNLVYLAGRSPVPGLDLTPLAMTLSGVIGAWVVLRRDLLDLIPVARETLVEKLADGVLVLDERGRIVDVNPAAARGLDVSALAVVGAPAAAVLAEWPALLAALDGTASDTGEIVTAGSRVLDFRVSPLRDRRQRVTGRLVSLRDVTERRRVEHEVRRLNEQLEQRVAERTAELSRSQERFETLARVAPVGIYRMDTLGQITYANDTWREITGLGRGEARGKEFLEVIHAEDRDRFVTGWSPTAGSPESYRIEMRIRRRDGTVVSIMNHLMADAGADGIVRGAVGTLVDVTELKRAQEEQARLASLVENSPDLIAILGDERRLLYVNSAGRRLLGLTDLEDVGTRTALDFLPPEGQALIESVIGPAIRERGIWDGEVPLVHVETGQTIVLAGRCFLTRGAGQGAAPRLAILGRDVTAKKRAEAALRESEEQLRQAQKMEAVGRLAGGIAHDFNNLMAIVSGQGELLGSIATAGDDRSRESLELIREAARRAVGLTRQLLAISRKQLLQPTVLDLNEVVRDVGSLLRRVLGQEVEVCTTLAPDLGRVLADQSQLEQVILNLGLNAWDAMPQGGRLAIETRNVRVDTGTRSEYAMLVLEDSGTGIPPDVVPHIFEPFFTTKGPGEGTGLGLSTVYGIVQQHGGHITVDSVVGRGTTFRVYLPLVTESATAPAGQREEGPSGSETILVVEDERDVRTVTKRFLEGLGYTVIAAAGAEDALDLMETRGGSIDLVLTDVVMPGKSGRELGDELARRWPAVPVIFMSGYTGELIARRGMADAGIVLIPKPFTREELARAVRGALDRPRGTPPRSS